jgi:hypothetical protein
MTNKLTPEAAAAAAAAVAAKYTAKAWHAVPQGTTDRRVSSDAHKRLLSHVTGYKDAAKLVWIDTHDTWTDKLPVYVWREDEPGSARKEGHVEAIPKDWYKTAKIGASVVYIITGSVTQNIATARLWLGQTNISTHRMSGQHHQAVPAYVEYITQYTDESLGKDEATILAVAHHSASVGCCLTYKGAQFVGDFAVGHLFKDGEVTPLWCDKRAEQLGAAKQPDGTWA